MFVIFVYWLRTDWSGDKGEAQDIIISSCKGKLRIRNIIAHLPWESLVKIHERKGLRCKCIILPAIDYSFIRICIWVNDNQREDFDLHVLALTWRLFQEKFLGGLNILRLRHIIKTSKKLNLLIAKTVQVLEVKQKDLWNCMLGP